MTTQLLGTKGFVNTLTPQKFLEIEISIRNCPCLLIELRFLHLLCLAEFPIGESDLVLPTLIHQQSN